MWRAYVDPSRVRLNSVRYVRIGLETAEIQVACRAGATACCGRACRARRRARPAHGTKIVAGCLVLSRSGVCKTVCVGRSDDLESVVEKPRDARASERAISFPNQPDTGKNSKLERLPRVRNVNAPSCVGRGRRCSAPWTTRLDGVPTLQYLFLARGFRTRGWRLVCRENVTRFSQRDAYTRSKWLSFRIRFEKRVYTYQILSRIGETKKPGERDLGCILVVRKRRRHSISVDRRPSSTRRTTRPSWRPSACSARVSRPRQSTPTQASSSRSRACRTAAASTRATAAAALAPEAPPSRAQMSRRSPRRRPHSSCSGTCRRAEDARSCRAARRPEFQAVCVESG